MRSTLVWVGRLLLAVYFLVAALILVGRHVLMPQLAARPDLVEQQLSAALGLPVHVAAFRADWPGFFPRLALSGLAIHDAAGRPALTLDRVEAEIGWTSLFAFELRLHRLEIVAPRLVVRRDATGALTVAGLPVSGGAEPGLADWLLAQHRIVVRDAQVEWQDALRAAPPLRLEQVNFELRNFVHHHSFGLNAAAAEAPGGRLDVRANLRGASSTDWAGWQGRLYADLGALDIAAWRPWFELPLDLAQGRGQLRFWLDFAQRRPTALTADLSLADVSLRLDPALPVLALERIDGRVALSRDDTGYTGELRQLTLVAGEGRVVEPTDARLRVTTSGRKPGGEFRINRLDLAALGALADAVPLPPTLRERLQALAPRGRLADFSLDWQGPAEAPEHWRVKGGFAALGLAAQQAWPGFGGLSGRIEGDARAGKLVLDSRDAVLELPAVLPEPTLPLTSLQAEIGWRRPGEATLEILLPRVVFANDDAAGELTGSYRYDGAGPGEIDLSARLMHAAGTSVWRYLPTVVGPETRDWLRASLRGGLAPNTTLRLKGPLAQFPFRGGHGGIFQIRGAIQGAQLDYAAGWPGIADIDGELLFENERMLIRARRASLMDVALSEVRAEIPDLAAAQEILNISGRARGATQRFLDFIEASPVGEHIEHFTAPLAATGDGDLDLKLALPLRRLDTAQVQGRYRFAANTLMVSPQLPPLTDVTGELGFGADRVQAKALRARFLDQPLTAEVDSLPGGTVRINAAGSLDAQALRGRYGVRALDHLAGTTPWRGVLTVRPSAAELNLVSDLRGLTSSLPEPFNKRAADAMPLILDGRLGGRGDAWRLTLGKQATLRVESAGEAWRGRLAVGELAVQREPSLPATGLAVTVDLPRLDGDAWRALGSDTPEGDATQERLTLPLTAFELRTAELGLQRRVFHDVAVQGTPGDGRWRFDIASREAQGRLVWEGGGAGRIGGHLARLHLPAGSGPEPAGGVADDEASREMPALDLVIDSLRIDTLALGTTRLKAENRAGTWQAQLDLDNEAARLTGSGRWRPGRDAHETALTFKLDVVDAEKLLDRLGLPDAVRRGEGRIEGELRWAASPFGFDVPSLSGQLSADFGKGQFKKLEPGVGRLLGVLSLQSLPRRITLDFRDIFSAGFAFDSIAGTARIARGVITTDELRIRGPAAKVLLSGRVDLGAETQDLRVEVRPALGETLAVGAMLANPVVGAAAWATQKLLNDPLDQIFAYEYAVTGSWSDPQVAKLNRAATPAPASTSAPAQP